MKIQRIIFWQNVLSIHQSAFVRTLAARPGLEVWFAHEEDLTHARRAMGWMPPDFGAARVVDVRDPVKWNELVAMTDPATCHAFGSYFILPRAYAAFKRLRPASCRRVWITEAFDFHGWRGWIRLQRVRWHAFREVRTGFHHVFAMGDLGMKFYRRAGIKPEQLNEFGYLVEPPMMREVNTRHDGSDFQFIFVGQLIARKGVDLLLQAAGRLPQTGWSLKLIGDGVERESLMAQAAAAGLSSRVQFLDNQSNALTLAAIRSADVLVLPSRWDGWGAVVNEALMLGTPVIVSDSCGAASLIVNDTCGWICRRDDSEDLSLLMQSSLESPRTTEDERQKLRDWAMRALGGDSMADHFLHCLNSNQPSSPVPPWRNRLPA